MSKGNWGADQTDERKPTWPWVSEYVGYANCFATGGGWTVRWPWGDEVIVALSNLTTKLGNSSIGSLTYTPISGMYLVNAASQALHVVVGFNEAVTVSGTPTLQLISGNASHSNVTASYNSAASNLSSGKVVFSNQSFTLAQVGYAANSLVVNSTSVVSGWDGISDAGNANDVANGIPSSFSLSIPIYQEKPVHVATLRVGTANSSVNGQIGFALDFNELLVLGGNSEAITLRAIADANATNGNLVCTLNVSASNLALGNLVFQSAVTDFNNVNAGIYTINTTSVLTGWDGIKNSIGGVVANSIIVANTFTVTV